MPHIRHGRTLERDDTLGGCQHRILLREEQREPLAGHPYVMRHGGSLCSSQYTEAYLNVLLS